MQLSEKIQSHLLFAHVRAASPGSVVAERLCHPFRSVWGYDIVDRIPMPIGWCRLIN
jgi:predicted glutamine amidotransferase